MFVRGDIADILDNCDLCHDVFVVKHDYTPKTESKFLGNKQHVYHKKTGLASWCSTISPRRADA